MRPSSTRTHLPQVQCHLDPLDRALPAAPRQLALPDRRRPRLLDLPDGRREPRHLRRRLVDDLRSTRPADQTLPAIAAPHEAHRGATVCLDLSGPLSRKRLAFSTQAL
jgi:hypothetical protein